MKNYKTESNSFVLYKNWKECFTTLSDKQAGILIKALFEYACGEDIQPFAGGLKIVFLMMAQQLDRDGAKWMETCERRAEAGRKGGLQKQANLANATFAKQRVAKVAENENDTENEYDTVNEYVNENDTVRTEAHTCADKPRERARAQGEAFIPPTVSEVAAYCAERKNGIDAQYFVDYFAANGWMLGKTPMQDWRAAVRRWERSGIRSAPKPASTPYHKLSQSSIRDEDIEALMCQL